MIYKTIFILIAVILCWYIIRKLYEYDLKEMWFSIFQIIFTTVMCLIFLEIRNLIFFVLFILISFLLKYLLKNIFFSKRKIKIIKR